MSDVKIDASKIARTTEVIRLAAMALCLVAGAVMLCTAISHNRAARRAYGSHDDCPNR